MHRNFLKFKWETTVDADDQKLQNQAWLKMTEYSIVIFVPVAIANILTSKDKVRQLQGFTYMKVTC